MEAKTKQRLIKLLTNVKQKQNQMILNRIKLMSRINQNIHKIEKMKKEAQTVNERGLLKRKKIHRTKVKKSHNLVVGHRERITKELKILKSAKEIKQLTVRNRIKGACFAQPKTLSPKSKRTTRVNYV